MRPAPDPYVMPILFQKLQKYADLALHWIIFVILLKFIFTPREKLLTFIRVPLKSHSAPNRIIEKIRSYVSIYLNIRRKCGVQDTCLTRSLFLCRALREKGIDARVQFGVRAADAHERQALDDEKTTGHCWVMVPGEQIPHNFPLVVTCP